MHETVKCRKLQVNGGMHHWLEEEHCIVGRVTLPHAAVLDFVSPPNIQFSCCELSLGVDAQLSCEACLCCAELCCFGLAQSVSMSFCTPKFGLFSASMHRLSDSVAMEPIRVPCSWSVDSSWVYV